MHPTTTKNLLTINQLEIELFLGWPNEERLRKQIVILDIELHFETTPKACTTDHLDDTYCYRRLIEHLRTRLSDQKFHLIEHVTLEIYQLLKFMLPAETKILVSLTKRPQIEGLGSVTYQHGDGV